MPDLTLVFSNARILDDVSLHPCVRYVGRSRSHAPIGSRVQPLMMGGEPRASACPPPAHGGDCVHTLYSIARWERERVVSFVPPDGHFKLMSYRCVAVRWARRRPERARVLTARAARGAMLAEAAPSCRVSLAPTTLMPLAVRPQINFSGSSGLRPTMHSPAIPMRLLTSELRV